MFGIYPVYIGKESNSYEEVEQGTIQDWDEVRSEYFDPKSDPWNTLVRLVLKELDCGGLARMAGVSERHITRLRNARQMPSPELRQRLTRSAGDYARSCISEPELDDLAAWHHFCAEFKTRVADRVTYFQICA